MTLQDEARELLRPWLYHKPDCNHSWAAGAGMDCRCGLTAALAALTRPMLQDEARQRAISAVANLEMDREGRPYSRTQEEFITDAAETVDAVLATLTHPMGEDVEDAVRLIDDAYCAADQEPCRCNIDELSCPHCNAWDRARQATRAVIASLSPALVSGDDKKDNTT
jgi:hypothetical protein